MAKRNPRMPGESNKKEEKAKEYYTVSDIIRKILYDLNLEYSEANARNIRRIIESYYKFTNSSKKTKFSKEDLKLIYGLTKNLFLNDNAKKIFNKLGNKKELNIEEIDILADIFKDTLEENYGKEEGEKFLEEIKKIKGEDFLKCSDDMKSKFEYEYECITEKLYSLKNTNIRDNLIKNINYELTTILDNFNYEVGKASYMEYALNKIIKTGEKDKLNDMIESEELKYEMFINISNYEFLKESFEEALNTLEIDDIGIGYYEYSNEAIDTISEEMHKNQMDKMIQKIEKNK